MNTSIKEFSLKVQLCCSKKGISQEDLVEKTQLDPEIIKKIFNGEYDVTIDEIEIIAEVLEVQPFQLLLPSGYGAIRKDGSKVEEI